jgi:hypothetical protein
MPIVKLEDIADLCKEHNIPQEIREELLKGEGLRIIQQFSKTDGLEAAWRIAMDWLMLSEHDYDDWHEDEDSADAHRDGEEDEILLEEWVDAV